MIREELIHPATIHFSIAFLTFVTPIYVIYLYKKNKNIEFLLNFFFITGLATLAGSMFLGDMALDIVKKDLCRIQDAYAHEEHAYYTMCIFILSYASFMGRLYVKEELKKWPLLLGLILSIGANFYLVKTGHSGSNLVYEQGAGVKNFKCP